MLAAVDVVAVVVVVFFFWRIWIRSTYGVSLLLIFRAALLLAFSGVFIGFYWVIAVPTWRAL